MGRELRLTMESLAGWQYVAYYANDLSKRIPTRNVCLARRRLPGVAESDALEGKTTTADWQTIIFGDYEQTLNDGHNVGPNRMMQMALKTARLIEAELCVRFQDDLHGPFSQRRLYTPLV